LNSPGCSGEDIAAIKKVVEQVLDILADKIEILNFWQRPEMVSDLAGKLQEIFILSGIPALEKSFDQITTDVMDLAKRRELDILSSKKSQGVS